MSPSCHIPFWWAIFPPSQEVLRGLMAMGYEHASLYFLTLSLSIYVCMYICMHVYICTHTHTHRYQDAALYFNRNDPECKKLQLLRAHARPQAHV